MTDTNRAPLVTVDQLKIDFAYLDEAIAEIEAKIADAPSAVEDDEDLSVMREIVKALLTQHKRVEALRVDTKEPYLLATRVVDGHFNTLKTMLEKRQAGIEALAKVYLDRKKAEEQARRDAEARRAAEEQRRLAAEAQRAEAEAAAARRRADEERRREEEAERRRVEEERKRREAAEQARIAAERAERQRIEEEQRAAKSADEAARLAAEAEARRLAQEEVRKQQEAERSAEEERRANERRRIAAETERAAAEAEAQAAARREQEASAAALMAAKSAEAKPADMARTLTAGGGMATLKRSYDFEILDCDLIPLESMRSYIVTDDYERIIKRYISMHKDGRPLAGIRIFETTSAQFR
jgi:hypothetical protein